MRMSRHALLVCPDFPPVVGGHVQPLVKLVKYMARCGWRLTVVTQTEDALPDKDPSLLAEVPPGTEVIRTRNADPLMRMWVRRNQDPPEPRSRAGGSIVRAPHRDRRAVSPTALAVAAGRPFLPLARALFRHVVHVPDELTTWIPGALVASRRVIRRDPPAVLISTCPAYSAHLVGLALHRWSGLPWIADFRDLWVGRPYRRMLSRVHTRWELVLEGLVVRRSTRLVVASPVFADVLAERYGDEVGAKTAWISNGYDPADYEGPMPAPLPHGRFHIVYTGAMFDAESPVPFLEALGRVAASDPGLVEPVMVSLAGRIGDAERLQAEAAIERYRLGTRVAFLGVRPHRECIALQRSADLLLLISGRGHTDNIRTKSIEYLAAGKPVFAMLPMEGIQAAIYKRINAGPIVPAEDVAAAEEGLRTLLANPRQCLRGFAPDRAEIEAFDYRTLAARLAAICQEIAS